MRYVYGKRSPNLRESCLLFISLTLISACFNADEPLATAETPRNIAAVAPDEAPDEAPSPLTVDATGCNAADARHRDEYISSAVATVGGLVLHEPDSLDYAARGFVQLNSMEINLKDAGADLARLLSHVPAGTYESIELSLEQASVELTGQPGVVAGLRVEDRTIILKFATPFSAGEKLRNVVVCVPLKVQAGIASLPNHVLLVLRVE